MARAAKCRLNRAGTLALILSVLALLSPACTPSSMQVRSGVEPAYVDQSVRFRTTYYFRVFDICAPKSGSGDGRVMLDSLYRFEMTGKASGLGTTVHFESGTLKKDEIDPFGASVRYNNEVNAYEVRSRSQVEEEAKRKRDLAEIKELIKYYEDVKIDSKLDGKISSQLESLVEKKLTEFGASKPADPAHPDATGKTIQESGCPPENQIKRGFQVLGPEGFRTFDPDERLIMAMVSSAKPLIGALQQASEQLKTLHTSAEDPLRILVLERLRAALAATEVAKKNDTDAASEVAQAAKDKLNSGDPP